jgi:hypothetical protein
MTTERAQSSPLLDLRPLFLFLLVMSLPVPGARAHLTAKSPSPPPLHPPFPPLLKNISTSREWRKEELQDPISPQEGWYPALPGERHLHIPGPSGSWPEVQAQFLRAYIHPWSAQPTIEGAAGQHTGVYGESLFADPRPDILPSRPEGELQQFLSADNYFHGGAQRAIWQLGDYGVAADVWRLQSLPLRQKSLHEQELTVLRLENAAKHERHRVEQEKQGLLIDKFNVETRLKEARVMERLHPYLRRDGVRREVKIDPVQTRKERNKRIKERRARQARHTCPLCQKKGSLSQSVHVSSSSMRTEEPRTMRPPHLSSLVA